MSVSPGREVSKEVRSVIKSLLKQGWRYEYGGGRPHPRLYPPDTTHSPITLAGSCSDRRAFMNFLGDVRRAGGNV